MNSRNRSEVLAAVEAQPNFDVLVVGGGINGIGTFRDLALQGVRVLLVEKSDFCSGASAASSHMVHGGIRYLENGEFRLVRESVHERNRLLENAPHYVRRLPTVIPIFKRFSGLLNAPLKFLGWLQKPSERGSIVIKLGLMMYDGYTRKQKTVPGHRFLSRRKALAEFPLLNSKIVNAAIYYDAAFDMPERLGLEVLLDGLDASPDALALNYVAAVGSKQEAGQPTSVELMDQQTGNSFSVTPKLIVNAAGPWIDLANEALGTNSRFMGGTKGSHLVLNHPQLREAIGENEFFFENTDGRITLIFPFRNRVLIGTSDIPIDHPDEARCTEEEVDYFLDMIKIVFPEVVVERSHIVHRFSGVRPLPASDANTPGQVSRDHSIQTLESEQPDGAAILSLVGGKWTTFRAFSEHVTNVVLERLGRSRVSSTQDLPIGGGKDFPKSDSDQKAWLASLESETQLSGDVLQILFDRYGTGSQAIAKFIASQADVQEAASIAVEVSTGNERWFKGELEYMAQFELVCRAEDILARRSLIEMQGLSTAETTKVVEEILARV